MFCIVFRLPVGLHNRCNISPRARMEHAKNALLNTTPERMPQSVDESSPLLHSPQRKASQAGARPAAAFSAASSSFFFLLLGSPLSFPPSFPFQSRTSDRYSTAAKEQSTTMINQPQCHFSEVAWYDNLQVMKRKPNQANDS